MQRFCLYKGVPGVLVGHPSQRLGERRYLGKRRRELAEGEKFEELHQLFDDVAECALDHSAMRKCVAAGELELLAGPVAAKDMADALAQLEKAPSAPKKSLKLSKAGSDS